MKRIYTVNKILFIINILLYLMVITFFLALMFQILLGAVQLLIFFYLLYQFKQFRPSVQKLIIGYGLLVLLYGIIAFLQTVYNIFNYNEILEGTFAALIPMLLAGFHVYITYQLKNKEL